MPASFRKTTIESGGDDMANSKPQSILKMKFMEQVDYDWRPAMNTAFAHVDIN